MQCQDQGGIPNGYNVSLRESRDRRGPRLVCDRDVERAVMDERTLTALKGSIAKWEGRAGGKFLLASIDNCPLCTLFYDEGCEGCPIAARTEETCCRGTPCADYADLADECGDEARGLAALAMAEVEFLKSLLPEAQP